MIDIRPMSGAVRNVRFIRADLMQGAPGLAQCTDSLSCLHALEHFGLGRYGDPIDPDGHLRGFRALIGMLQPAAVFYLSFPIGLPVVEFNAHRVFDAREVLRWPGSEQLRLSRFDYVDDAGELHEDVPPDQIGARCAGLVHGCGIYTFVRIAGEAGSAAP